MKKILLVEDEDDIRVFLKSYLEKFDFLVEEAVDGSEALIKFDNTFDLILLDILLPGLNGIQVCNEIRKVSQVPVILLTALCDEQNIIDGYLSKADDYVTKPFSIQVLLLKIKALLRRSRKEIENPVHRIGSLKLDSNSRKAFEDGKEIFLTQKEFDLLCLMIDHPGMVYTRQMLLDQLWDDNYEERIVDTHIKNIRKKLKKNYITTIRGLGYRIDQ